MTCHFFGSFPSFSSLHSKCAPQLATTLAAVGLWGFACLLNVVAIPSAAHAATPADTLVIGFDTKPKSSDPRLIGTDANSQYVEELRFLPLVSSDPSGAIKNVVAESFVPSGKFDWKVTMRKGIQFANGREMNADDVVATFQTLITGQSGLPPSPRKGAYAKVKSVAKTGPYEILFSLTEPDAPFVTNLVIGILPKEAATALPEAVNGKGFESGPYILEKQADDEWVLVRNEKYTAAPYAGKKPALAKVSLKIITDNNTRYAALEKGDLDVVQNTLDSDKVVEIQKNQRDKFNVVTRTSLNTTFIGLNMRDRALSNPDVRLAIAKGINRDEILRYSLQGLGEKATGMFPVGLPYHEKSLGPIEYDPKGAIQLLEKAGYKGRTRLKFSLKVPTNKERIAVAKAIAGQLKRIGIDVVVESLESGTFSKQLGDGLVAAWVAPWTGYKDPDHLHFVFASKQVPPFGANRGFYSNAKLDELLEKGKSEVNMDKRLPFYSEAQKILAADLPYVFLWHKFANVVTAKNVKGYVLYADGRYSSITEVTKN